MKPFFVLIISFGISQAVLRLTGSGWDTALAGNIAMFIMLCFTAIAHFAFTEGMAMMLPPFVPMRRILIYLTGLMEIGFGILLLFPSWRYMAGIAILIFFITLLRANIYAASRRVNYEKGNYEGKGWKYLWFRVPLQLFFIAWVWLFAIHPVGA